MKENNNEDKIQICSFPILLKYPRRQKKEMKTYNFLLLAGEVLQSLKVSNHSCRPLNQDSIKSWNSQSVLTKE